MIPRPKSDFPWYNDDKWYWMADDYHFRISQVHTSRLWGSFTYSRLGRHGEYDDEDVEVAKGPLAKVPYLVYLGTEDAARVWPGAVLGASEFAF
tara:strand:+ start:18993 stop:19274 length:282 start_codon:yes stop_codon:yes gene_type:complete